MSRKLGNLRSGFLGNYMEQLLRQLGVLSKVLKVMHVASGLRASIVVTQVLLSLVSTGNN
jgi:hypothetical protein